MKFFAGIINARGLEHHFWPLESAIFTWCGRRTILKFDVRGQ